MKNLQDLKISADSADSLYTTNPRNRRKVQKTLYYYQINGWMIFLTELKLVPNVQSSRKLNRPAFHLKEKTGVMWYKNWYRLPNFVALPLRHSLLVIWRFEAVTLKIWWGKGKNLQDLKISADSADLLSTAASSQNRWKVEKTS